MTTGQAHTCMLQEREESCSLYLFTFGSKSDEFILQEQVVCIVSFTQDNSSLTKLSKFLNTNIQVHKNEKILNKIILRSKMSESILDT